MNTYTITFADKTKLENLILNGNNFVTDTELTEEFFTPEKLSKVIIERNSPADEEALENFMEDFDLTGEHEFMKLVQVLPYKNQYWFILRDRTPEELEAIKLESRLAYLEMMTE